MRHAAADMRNYAHVFFIERKIYNVFITIIMNYNYNYYYYTLYGKHSSNETLGKVDCCHQNLALKTDFAGNDVFNEKPNYMSSLLDKKTQCFPDFTFLLLRMAFMET